MLACVLLMLFYFISTESALPSYTMIFITAKNSIIPNMDPNNPHPPGFRAQWFVSPGSSKLHLLYSYRVHNRK